MNQISFTCFGLVFILIVVQCASTFKIDEHVKRRPGRNIYDGGNFHKGYFSGYKSHRGPSIVPGPPGRRGKMGPIGRTGPPGPDATHTPQLLFMVAQEKNLDIDQNDHVEFNEVKYQSGTYIDLDEDTTYTNANDDDSAGRITLRKGKTYELIGSLNHVTFGSSLGFENLQYSWYDLSNSQEIGTKGSSISATSGNAVHSVAQGIITPSSDIKIELRILENEGATQIGSSGSALPTGLIKVIE